MAVAFALDKSGQAANPVALSGGHWLLPGTVTFSGTYATGGDALDLKPYFPAGRTIRSAVSLGDPRGINLEYDLANAKLKAYTDGVELTAGAYPAGAAGTALPAAFLLKG